MKVGFDYWQVLSHFPDEIAYLEAALKNVGAETHVISAIGKGRVGTIAPDVLEVMPYFSEENVHEVVFNHPRESPELKLAKCQELGITMFFDDRDDVCKLLNEHGIVAMRVTRKLRGGDINSERK